MRQTFAPRCARRPAVLDRFVGFASPKRMRLGRKARGRHINRALMSGASEVPSPFDANLGTMLCAERSVNGNLQPTGLLRRLAWDCQDRRSATLRHL